MREKEKEGRDTSSLRVGRENAVLLVFNVERMGKREKERKGGCASLNGRKEKNGGSHDDLMNVTEFQLHLGNFTRSRGTQNPT